MQAEIFCVIAIVIVIGVMVNSFVTMFCVDSNVNGSVIDEHLEALEVLEDDMLMAVIEYNEAYYANYVDELPALDGNG
jgi:hypothetical protein